MPIARTPPQIALGDRREIEPISECSRCGAVPWTPFPGLPAHWGRARTTGATHTCGSIDVYFFAASLDLAGAAATQAPLPSLPAFSSHFILAFSQSALLVGVVACCAMAVGANASSAITAVIGNSFMSGLHCLPGSIHRR